MVLEVTTMRPVFAQLLRVVLGLSFIGCDNGEVADVRIPAETEQFEGQIKAFWEELKRDDRMPSRGNLSGVWSSRGGQIFQLEQTGTAVSGRSFQHNCIGSGLEEVEGSFAGDILMLRLRRADEKEFTTRAFELVSTAAGLTLREFVEGTVLYPMQGEAVAVGML